MLLHKYGSAAMVATKRSTGVSPEVNVKECTSCMLLPSANKAAHSGFETQRRPPEVQNRGISRPTKRIDVLQFFFQKSCI